MHSAKNEAKQKEGKRIEDWGLRIIVRILFKKKGVFRIRKV